MKPAPRFDAWPLRPPPNYQHWMIGGLVVLALVGSLGVLLRPVMERWLPLIGLLALALWLLALLLRTLFFRFNRHNADCYTVAAQGVEHRWWSRHRQQAGLVEMVLLGPSCSAPQHRARLFMLERRPPPVVSSDAGKVLRIGQVLFEERSERERQLARMLALQLQVQRPEPFAEPFLACHWQGSLAAWKHFAAEMHQRFQLTLPEQPEPWLGQNSLDSLIDRLHDAPEQALVLCAGCESAAPDPHSPLPAGEAAVLWLLGKSGSVRVGRGESFLAAADDLATVAARALQQGGLAPTPLACAGFAAAADLDLSGLDWTPLQPPPETHFGELPRLQGMIALSLAAAHARLNAASCAWLAADPSCTLALGVVTADDSTR
ncbi:hypothetical protein ACIP1T_27545 [Pseudomonas japonica]|uniref:hypothetical protein n=1 Tax=Pseudomonas japonica TaxID=256466 RepID=UPI0037F9F602